MRTELRIVASAHRSPRIDSVGGLSARSTGPDTVHLIGTAATPLGGDEVFVHISVGPDARLTVRSVAASVALPSASDRISHAVWSFEVEDGGVLDFDPEPMIVAADAVHRVVTRVDFTAAASIRIRERVQIGRSGESAGHWVGRLHSDIEGRPHVRHRVELGVGTAGHDVLAAPMSMASLLTYPDVRAADSEGTRFVRMPLASGGSLATYTGSTLDALVKSG